MGGNPSPHGSGQCRPAAWTRGRRCRPRFRTDVTSGRRREGGARGRGGLRGSALRGPAGVLAGALRVLGRSLGALCPDAPSGVKGVCGGPAGLVPPAGPAPGRACGGHALSPAGRPSGPRCALGSSCEGPQATSVLQAPENGTAARWAAPLLSLGRRRDPCGVRSCSPLRRGQDAEPPAAVLPGCPARMTAEGGRGRSRHPGHCRSATEKEGRLQNMQERGGRYAKWTKSEKDRYWTISLRRAFSKSSDSQKQQTVVAVEWGWVGSGGDAGQRWTLCAA